VEKPDQDTARRLLRTNGLPEGRYLAHCGIYLFDAEIFDCLEEEQFQVESSQKELELAAAQLALLRRHPESYNLYHIEGKAYDTGNPEGYLRALGAVGRFDGGTVVQSHGHTDSRKLLWLKTIVALKS